MAELRTAEVSGLAAVEHATALLQRMRLASAVGGVWEAADIQWAWRRPSPANAVGVRFWCDDAGPVAGFVLETRKETWECAPLWSPDLPGPALAEVWACAQETAAAHAAQGYGVLVRDDDTELGALVRASGLVPGDGDATAWMQAAERPEPQPAPAGFVLVDRTQRTGAPHPLRHLNGAAVESRLRQCSLYDPALDLSVESRDGRLAGYAVFWHDPVTKVGLVEPVRVMEGFRRRGVARVLLAEGIARLAARGAERIKVSYETEAAGALYLSLGFERESQATWHRWERAGSPRSDGVRR